MTTTRHPSDWRNAPARTRWLAVAALAAIAAGVILTTVYSGAAAKAVGPTLIARNAAGETLLANSTTLFLVAPDQATVASLPVGSLSLRGPIMSVAADGAQWFIGDDASGMLYRCDLRARRCEAALQRRGDARIFRRAHRVASTHDRIFLTDSEAHRLLVFDRDGQPLAATRTGPVELCFPNGIVAVDDVIHVADTNNFRIARVLAKDPLRSVTFLQVNQGAALERANCRFRSGVLGERGTPVLNTAIDSSRTMVRPARPPARIDRVWPASLLPTRGGEWWVVQMANRMRNGDVIRYGADGAALGRIALPPGADPIELTEARDEVLITDAGLGTVHRVSQQGEVLGAWGPPAFQEALRGIRADRQTHRNLQFLATGVAGAGVLAALLVVVWEVRRQRSEGWAPRGTLAPVAATPGELGAGILWIPVDPAFLRRTRRTAWALGLYLLATIALVVYLAVAHGFSTQLGRIHAALSGVMLAVIAIVIALLARHIARLPRQRLGVSREGVRFDPGSGEDIFSTWDRLRVGPRGLLLGKHLLQVVDPLGRHQFPREELETQVLGRLPRSAFLDGGRMTLEALRRGNAPLWSVVLALAVYVLFLLVKTCGQD